MINPPIGNLFADSEPPATGERFETLLKQRNLVVERILSSGRQEAVDYVQEQDEWVMLVRGEARLNLAGEVIDLVAGDYLFVPARVTHRVESASEGALWLAVHLHPQVLDVSLPV